MIQNSDTKWTYQPHSLAGDGGHPKTRCVAPELRRNKSSISAKGVGSFVLNGREEAIPFHRWPELAIKLVGDSDLHWPS
jgi:hypothetical protein